MWAPDAHAGLSQGQWGGGAAVEVDVEIEGLTLLFERIVGHGEGRQLESYSTYLFTVDTEVRL